MVDPAEKKSNYGAVEEEEEEEKNGAPTKDPEEEAPPPPPQHSFLGILLVMIGAFSFSIMFLVVKLMEGTADSFTLVFYRSLVQLAISLGTLIYNGENPLGPPNAKTRFWLSIRGSFGAGAVIAWFFGIQNLPLPDAVTLQFTTPPFAAAFAVCLVGEQWLLLDMIGAVVCLAGVALIAHPTWLFGSPGGEEENTDESTTSAAMKALAVLVTTAGAAMAGIAYVSVRKIGDEASANVMVLYYALMSFPIVFFGSYWLKGEWNVWGDGTFSLHDCFLLLMTGLGGYGGQFFTNLGLQKETAATATLGTTTQIVWTYIFEMIFLHEGVNVWSLCGTGLILGYMLFVGHLKLKSSRIEDHDVCAGETEECALLYTSERHHIVLPTTEDDPENGGLN